MTDPEDDLDRPRPVKAYRNETFLSSRAGRPLRIQAEYLEPQARFEALGIQDTIVFFGSARIPSREDALAHRDAVREHGGDVDAAERKLAASRYYEEARDLAYRMTTWSKGLRDDERRGPRRRFVVCTGGGPGLMEAANRGASEAGGMSVGLNISLPHEQRGNPYITHNLTFEFHYFMMRKFWFAYLAKALVIFPGGFGTLDELFELLTLLQTGKLRKNLPIVLYGSEYWNEVVNLDAMVKWGTLEADDLALFHRADTVEEAFAFLTQELEAKFLTRPGPEL